jgi:hydrogenase small subunit
MGTIAHLILFGKPELDKEGDQSFFTVQLYMIFVRDVLFFEKRIFAESVGDQECMFKLGCRGPVTKQIVQQESGMITSIGL